MAKNIFSTVLFVQHTGKQKEGLHDLLFFIIFLRN